MRGRPVAGGTGWSLGFLPGSRTGSVGETAGPYTLHPLPAEVGEREVQPSSPVYPPRSLVAVGQVTLGNRAALLARLAHTPLAPHGPCSDGELLLRLYAHEGVAGFAQVSGMFALALRDGPHLVLVRDAVGGRKLFYTRTAGFWAASPSLRCLRRWHRLTPRLNLSAVQTYLTFAYLPGEETLLEGVWELLPGHALRIGLEDGTHELIPYWSIQEPPWDPSDPPEQYVSHLRQLLDAAVSGALPPGEPVAVFLSGGIDSSLVTALAARQHDQPITTYAIHFGERHPNELAYAHLVASHCRTHHRVIGFNGNQVCRHLAETMAHLDSPVGDPLTVPNLLLARAAAADGFRVVLNGEGGDPCFGGPKNLPMLLFELYRGNSDPDPGSDPAARARTYLRAYRECYDDLPVLLSPAAWDELRPAPPVERLVQPFLESPTMRSWLNRLMLTNVRTKGAHHILAKVESLTAACGLEGRSPLFDRTIVEYSFAIPPELKLAGTTEKWVLKRAVEDVLPAIIVFRPKSGMRVPIQSWLLGSPLLRPTPLRPWFLGPLGRLVSEVLL
ncbi:MAG: asparagine synthase, partial [Chloroflexaceae bacterium]|nr:asparagine synthase [Chloroflexaceae bacterium]